MTDRPKKDIMPTIFSLLPITLHKATSPLGAFFLYPFSYPKTEKGDRRNRKMVTCPDCGKTMLEKNFRYQHIYVCYKARIPKTCAKPIEDVIMEKRDKARNTEPKPEPVPLVVKLPRKQLIIWN